MNILINLCSTQKEENNVFHGGNEYTNKIVATLIEKNICLKNNLYFFCNSIKLLDNNLVSNITLDDNSFFIEKIKCRNLEYALEKYNIDKLFDPLGVELGSFTLKNVEVIYTIHGLRPLEMPTDINEFYLESKIKYILKNLFLGIYKKKVKKSFQKAINLQTKFKKLITVSEHTKNTIVAEFNVNPQDIMVLYSPEKLYPNINPNDEILFFNKMQGIEPLKYFLIVSSKRWIKNTYRVIKAFDELINENLLKYKIVMTGSNKKVKRLVKNINMFYMLNYVETKELEILYKNAFSLIYSYY